MAKILLFFWNGDIDFNVKNEDDQQLLAFSITMSFKINPPLLLSMSNVKNI